MAIEVSDAVKSRLTLIIKAQVDDLSFSTYEKDSFRVILYNEING